MIKDLLHYLRVFFSSAWIVAGATLLTLASLWEIILGSATPGWLLIVGFAVVLVVAGFRPWRQAIQNIAALEEQLSASDESPFALLRRRAARCGFDAATVGIMNMFVDDDSEDLLDHLDSERRWWLSSVRELAGASAGEVIADSDSAVRNGDNDAVLEICNRLISVLQARDPRLWSAFTAGKNAGAAMMTLSNDGAGDDKGTDWAMGLLPEISRSAHDAGLSANVTQRIIELLKTQKSDAISDIRKIVERLW